MESMKTRTMTKIGSKASNASKKKVVSSQEEKFTEREKKTIHELKKLYLETIKLDVELQREIYNMEKSFEEKHNKIFEQRTKIIEDFKKSSTPGDVAANANIPNFWLKVLKASYTEFISKKDEDILAHLMDIRTKLHNEPIVRFVIDFYFEPNEFFSNRVLTKTYYLSCLPDMEDPFTYDGAEIFKCEGCQIDWKHKEKEKDKKVYSSFFDFFNPPTLPDDVDDPTYSDINAILQNDFELGFYLKERVVPKAILFFTGEIADCQSSDSESDDDSDDDDEDDDDDDEEDDDDEDGSSANTPDE